MSNPVNAIELLVARMLSYDGNFDGYPGMSCTDETLIQDVLLQQAQEAPTDYPVNIVALLCYIASERVTNREEYTNCRNFIDDWFHTCWVCNMSEGSNPVHREIEEEDWQDAEESFTEG